MFANRGWLAAKHRVGPVLPEVRKQKEKPTGAAQSPRKKSRGQAGQVVLHQGGAGGQPKKKKKKKPRTEEQKQRRKDKRKAENEELRRINELRKQNGEPTLTKYDVKMQRWHEENQARAAKGLEPLPQPTKRKKKRKPWTGTGDPPWRITDSALDAAASVLIANKLIKRLDTDAVRNALPQRIKSHAITHALSEGVKTYKNTAAGKDIRGPYNLLGAKADGYDFYDECAAGLQKQYESWQGRVDYQGRRRAARLVLHLTARVVQGNTDMMQDHPHDAEQATAAAGTVVRRGQYTPEGTPQPGGPSSVRNTPFDGMDD